MRRRNAEPAYARFVVVAVDSEKRNPTIYSIVVESPTWLEATYSAARTLRHEGATWRVLVALSVAEGAHADFVADKWRHSVSGMRVLADLGHPI